MHKSSRIGRAKGLTYYSYTYIFGYVRTRGSFAIAQARPSLRGTTMRYVPKHHVLTASMLFSVFKSVMKRTVWMTITCFIIQVYSCSGRDDTGDLPLETQDVERDARYHKDSNATINSKEEILARFSGQVKQALYITRNIFKKDIRRLSNTDNFNTTK